MALKVTFELPPDIEERLRRDCSHLDADVKEAFAVSLFQQGKLSHMELGRSLGLDRFETDALLKRRGVFEGAPTMADVEADRATLERLMGRPG
jgi:predicted HTH domain antitoxin